MKSALHNIGISTSLLLFLHAINVSAEQDIIIIENDHANQITIHGEIGDDTNLFFGEALSHSLSWQNFDNAFIFSDSVSFSNNEIKNVRLENNILASKPCNTLYAGEVYFNTNDDVSYICDGFIWKQLENETLSTIGLKPYLEALDLSQVNPNQTFTLTVTGGNFTPNTVFELTTGAILNSTVITSDTSASLDITAGSSSAVVQVLTPLSFGNNLSFTIL